MLASSVLRPAAGSRKPTVTSSSSRVSLDADDDAVAPAGVSDAVAVAELALAGDDRAGSRPGARAGRPASASASVAVASQARTGRAERTRWRAAGERVALAARSRVGRNCLARPPARPAGRCPAARRRRRRGSGSRTRLVRRGTEDEVEVERLARRRPSSRRAAARPSARPGSRAGTATGPSAWPIPHVARRQAWDRYRRRFARVIPTYASRRSSSSSRSSSSARLCGKTPSSRPAMNTTGNSRPLAAWSVISVTASASPSYASWSATSAVSSSSRSSASSGERSS